MQARWHGILALSLLATGRTDGEEPRATRPAPELPVPGRVYIAEGHELNLWYDTLWPTGATGATVTLESPVGTSGERGFRWRPEPEQSGRSFPAEVRVRDERGQELASRAFELRVAPTGSDSARPMQLLFIGDSLTHGVPAECRGMISGEVQRLLETADGLRPLLLGRNDDQGGNRHEGLGGWSFQSFATPGSDVTRFRVAGVMQKPLVFSAYRCGEVTYRIQSRTLLPDQEGRMAGVMLCSVRTLDNKGLDLSTLPPPGPTGMLMRVDRATTNPGDAEMAFSGVETPVPANPFWDVSLNHGKGGLHLRKYMRDHRRFGGEDRIDYALIQLGVNDCFGVAVGKEAQTWMRLEAMLQHAKTLIRGIQDPVFGYRDCRIILALTPIGCNSADAYVRSYGAQHPDISMTRYESVVQELWCRLIREFDESPDWPQVRLSSNGLVTDRDNGYPRREMVVDGVKTLAHSNAVHPEGVGYRQCAEAYFAALCGWRSEADEGIHP